MFKNRFEIVKNMIQMMHIP